MLYVMPAPVGAVTVIVPVATVHVGCKVALAVGAAGVVFTVRVTKLLAALHITPLVVV